MTDELPPIDVSRHELDLLTTWLGDLAGHNSARVGEAHRDLSTRWSEPHRRYHDTHHLHEVISAIDELAGGGECTPDEARTARLAAWFHDAVYDPTRSDNESRSAALATMTLTRLGVCESTTTAVAQLVEASRDHIGRDDPVTRVFLDADLWILGSPPERFDEYCTQVREEYAVVPTPLYLRGRTVILTELTDRENIYTTTTARREWQDRARDNVRRELTRLGAG